MSADAQLVASDRARRRVYRSDWEDLIQGRDYVTVDLLIEDLYDRLAIDRDEAYTMVHGALRAKTLKKDIRGSVYLPKRAPRPTVLADDLGVDAAQLTALIAEHPAPTAPIVLGWAHDRGGLPDDPEHLRDDVEAAVDQWTVNDWKDVVGPDVLDTYPASWCRLEELGVER